MDRESQLGWTVASNDGLGGFEPIQELTLLTTFDFPLMDLWGSDFDGDGLLDLVVAEDGIVEVWYNWGDGFDPTLQLFDVRPVGLADGDGDGDTDLLVWEYDALSRKVILWINNGYEFVRGEEFVLGSEGHLLAYLPAGQPLGRSCEPVVVPARGALATDPAVGRQPKTTALFRSRGQSLCPAPTG